MEQENGWLAGVTLEPMSRGAARAAAVAAGGKLASIETQAELNAFIAAFRPQDDTEAEYWIGGRQKTVETASCGNCAQQNETPWGCWQWDDYDLPSLPALWEIWMPSDYCGTWPDWCQGGPPPNLDCVTGGWLPGEPDDGGSLNCVDTRQEDVMVLVLNHDDDPLEHGFADVDSNGVQPRKALIMRRAWARTPQEYERLWAYEFRYDGGRERYLVRKLDRFTLEPDGDTWTDYDVGGSVYGDYTLDGATPTEQTRYMPGLGQQAVGSAVDYLFGDQIGTLRMTRSATTPPVTTKRVYTAFGELVEYTGGTTRYGYAGAWGYQEHDADGANGPDNSVWDGDGCACGARIGEVLPFLHVGWRYYDPSTGRFLQRDPIGIDGGLNVYQYAGAAPTGIVDPQGLYTIGPPGPGGWSWVSLPPFGGPNAVTFTTPIAESFFKRQSWRILAARVGVTGVGTLACYGGLVYGAAEIGWGVGTAIDEEFGISDSIGRWAGTACPICFLPEYWF